MVRLSSPDLRAILEFLRTVYGAHPLEEHARLVTRGLGQLIGANYISYNEVDLRRGSNRPVVDPCGAVSFAGYAEGTFDRLLPEHPVVAHFVRTGNLAAARISDFLSQRAFHRLGIYQEFFRHVRTEHQLAAGVAASDGLLIDVGLNRTRPDFSERDRLVLDAVREHLAGAHQNAGRFSAVERDLALVLEGTEGTDAGLIVLAADGTIRMASGRARRLLEECFGPCKASPRQLPSALDAWVRHEAQTLARSDAVPPVRRPLVVERKDRRVVVRLFLDDGRAVLVLNEEFLELDPSLLAPLGLSGRETEVLAWVARGKTDAEIATIVGARPRTIGKHLERIYQKLGVENRTAAAARAFEAAALARGRLTAP